MSVNASQPEFQVNIMMQAAGPMRPRTKHKRHKLLRAEGSISLPFVPYPGLYLTYTKPKPRGMDLTLYLRVRAVEWNITEKRFECVADEILGSPLFGETHEVRGGARIEQHFVKLQHVLKEFGFEVDTDVEGTMALNKCEDGTVLYVDQP